MQDSLETRWVTGEGSDKAISIMETSWLRQVLLGSQDLDKDLDIQAISIRVRETSWYLYQEDLDKDSGYLYRG